MKLNELIGVVGVNKGEQWVELKDNLTGDVLANFAIDDLEDSTYKKFANCDVKDITSTKNCSGLTRLVVKVEYKKQFTLTQEEIDVLKSTLEKLG
ncbi:MAG: hypothetical protein IKT89_03020 [Clostridia bacterium]|nr:hypothetical protein [Clostridia bacterium]